MGCGNPCVGMTWALARTAIIVVIGTTYLFGYNMVVINNPKRVLQNFYNTSYASRNDGTPMSDKTFTGLWSFTAAIYSIGILSASFLTGRLANRFGRKRLMLMNSVVVLAGCLLMGLSKKANSFEMIIVGRLVFGLAAGFSSVATLYFMEISPRHLRGAMGGLYEFGFATSMLLSQLLGLEEVFGNEKFWTLLLCITAITTVFQLVSLPFSPESPRFLLCSQQKEKEALESLQFFRGTTDPEELREELEELRHEHQSQKTRQNLSMLEIIKDPTLRNALYVSFAVHLSLQLGGVIPVLYFSTHLFNKAGVAYGESAHASLGIGCVKILMNLFSMFVIERFGRRLPELVGCGGQAIMLVLLTITMHDSFTDYPYVHTLAIISTITFIAFNTFGPATICFMITAELFQENARPTAVSMSFFVNFTANFIVGMSFLPLNEAIGSYVFLIYAGFSILLFIYIYIYLPETRDRPIEEIVNEFRPKAERIKNFSAVTSGEDAKPTDKLGGENAEGEREKVEMDDARPRSDSHRSTGSQDRRYSFHRQMSLQNTPC